MGGAKFTCGEGASANWGLLAEFCFIYFEFSDFECLFWIGDPFCVDKY